MDYLVNCTDLILYSFQQLEITKELYKKRAVQDNFKLLRTLDQTVESILKLLHCVLSKNPDLAIFILNKKLVDNNLYVQNVFDSMSTILCLCNSEEVQMEAFKFMRPLLDNWPKGRYLLDVQAQNSEARQGFTLIEQGFKFYNQLQAKFISKAIDANTFYQKRNELFTGFASVLQSSFQAKVSFLSTGFYKEVVKQINTTIDYYITEDEPIFTTAKVSQTKASLSSQKKSTASQLEF